MADRKVVAGKIVSLHYTLKDDDGEVIDKSPDDEPLVYLHGGENIVPGLEKALEGHVVGDQLQVVVAPEDGYGEHDEDGVQQVPRTMFPDEAEVEEGAQFFTEDEEGNPIPFWVTEIEDDIVTIDLNHPLAGETLHFDVKIVEVRDATAEEKKHGHPHGEHGHDHD